MQRGEIWWTLLPRPTGSEAGFDRPSVIVQDEVLLLSKLRTVLVIPLSSTLELVGPITNVFLPARKTGLPKDSVAVGPHLMHVNRDQLKRRVGRVPPSLMNDIELAMLTALGMSLHD